jgi:hypothetical protein
MHQTGCVELLDTGPIQAADGIRDPEFRALLERMGQRFAAQEEEQPPALPTPQRRLPVFPHAARPVVNAMARSALFACVQGKDRQILDNVLLATVAGVEIRFTGRQWNQDDHDLLMQLVHMAAPISLGEYVPLSGYAVLRALGRDAGGTQYQALREDVRRLVTGTVSLRHSTQKVEYMGSLVEDAVHDERQHHWLIRLSPILLTLYSPSAYTLVDWEQRRQLRGKDLARWLHLYLATHAVPFPVKVATLKHLSGSRASALRTFRQQLRSALAELRTVGALVTWEIDANDVVYVDRGTAVTESQRQHITRHSQQLL